jgi:argininosuccinate lyase
MSEIHNKKDRKDPQSSGVRKGRFLGAMNEDFQSFNASVSFDKELYREDIRGSIAHARMLANQGIISQEEADKLQHGLERVLKAIENNELQLKEELEDIHVNVEHALREIVGDVAGKLHTARSRNDQIALDLKLYVQGKSNEILHELKGLLISLVEKALADIDLIMPGYTHLQRGQPIRTSHHLMAYFQMFRRDCSRFRDSMERANESPLGSAALAGTTFPIDRQWTAKQLGFDHVCMNSMDGVSDRDFALDFMFNCSMVMTHLSRLAEELIIWSSSEFSFCELPDEFCSGSSIMPQKKNPDACELIRGKTGRVYGDLFTLFTVLKALPLTYNKDLQEDKEPVFDAAKTVLGSVRIMAKLISLVEFKGEQMRKAASDPTMAATDLADSLTRRGIPFREAHERVGAMISNAQAGAGPLLDETRPPTPEEMIQARKHTGSVSKESLMEQIECAREFIDSL